MKARVHLVAVCIAIACALVPRAAPAQSTNLVQGLIEVLVHVGGKPLAGATVTACARGHEMKHRGICTDRIEGRTDSTGGFSFLQVTGRAWPSDAEVKRSPILAVADPAYAFGFRIDYEGKSAILVASGMGYGRTNAKMNCDFQPYLADRLKQGARPIADSAKPEFAEVYCKIDETISRREQ